MRFRRAYPVASAGFYPAAFGRSGLSCMGLDDHCPLSSNPISAGIGMTRWPCFYVPAVAVRHESSARRPERAIGRSLGFLPLTHRETGRLACVSFRIRRIFRFLVAAYGFVYRAGYAFGLHWSDPRVLRLASGWLFPAYREGALSRRFAVETAVADRFGDVGRRDPGPLRPDRRSFGLL